MVSGMIAGWIAAVLIGLTVSAAGRPWWIGSILSILMCAALMLIGRSMGFS